MMESIRTMPGALRLFLVYAFGILAVIGLSMRYIIDMAIETPITVVGVAAMALLAYTIFTVTSVLQRKQAGRPLALGLASLTIVAIPFFVLYGPPVLAIFDAALGILLLRGLTRPAVRTWLSEP